MSSQVRDIPIGITVIQKATEKCCRTTYFNRNLWYRSSVWVLTFLAYMSYHATRKTLSVVKTTFHRNCTELPMPPDINSTTDPNWCDWKPFDGLDSSSLLGALDSSFLFAYAGAMFISGLVAERVNLRYFLALGMILSGVACYLLGIAKTYSIHSLLYFILVQVFGGVVQTTGWPGVVAVMGNWFEKEKRGLIMGVWNSHTSIGNIVGTLMAGYYLETDWSLSFIIPGLLIAIIGFLNFLFLVTNPADVGCTQPNRPNQHKRSNLNKGVLVEKRNKVKYYFEENAKRKAKPPSLKQKHTTLTLIDGDGHGNGDAGDGYMGQQPEFNNLLSTTTSTTITTNSATSTSSTSATICSSSAASPNNTNAANAILNDCTNNYSTNTSSNRGEKAIVSIEDVKRGGNEGHPILANGVPDKAVGFFGALFIPGVIEFSLCLFFAKLVSYTFLYWLPLYIKLSTTYSATMSADISTWFDIGGIIGGIAAGMISDYSGMSATTCAGMLLLAIPILFIYNLYGAYSKMLNMTLLLLTGILVNGPYALITTAVSAELGTHHSLQGNSKALATVTAIIDGTGSIGAAVGPLLAGLVSGSSGASWEYVFYLLMLSDLFALMLLVRLVTHEVKRLRSSDYPSNWSP